MPLTVVICGIQVVKMIHLGKSRLRSLSVYQHCDVIN